MTRKSTIDIEKEEHNKRINIVKSVLRSANVKKIAKDFGVSTTDVKKYLSDSFGQTLNPFSRPISHKRYSPPVSKVFHHHLGIINVALIPLRLKDNLNIITKNNKTLLRIKPRKLNSWRAELLEKIQLSIDEGANIICTGELTYPLGKGERGNKDFQKKIARLSRENNVYVNLGSCHDFLSEVTNNNISYTFAPWSESPFLQRKRTMATQMNEGADPAQKQELNLITSPYGYLSVLICLDVACENYKKKIAMHNNRPNPENNKTLDLIVNPSYDSSRTIKGRCENISNATKTCCIHINDDDLDLFPAAIFMPDGETVKEVCAYKTIKTVAPHIHFFEVDMSNVLAARELAKIDTSLLVD